MNNKINLNLILRIILIINLIVVVSIACVNYFLNETEFHYVITIGIVILVNIVLIINLMGHKETNNKRISIINILLTLFCLITMFWFPVCYTKSPVGHETDTGEIKYLPYENYEYFNCYNIIIR